MFKKTNILFVFFIAASRGRRGRGFAPRSPVYNMHHGQGDGGRGRERAKQGGGEREKEREKKKTDRERVKATERETERVRPPMRVRDQPITALTLLLFLNPAPPPEWA